MPNSLHDGSGKSVLLGAGANGTTGWGWNLSNLARQLSLRGWRVYGQIAWPELPPAWRLEGWGVSPLRGQEPDVLLLPAGNQSVPTRLVGSPRAYVETFIEDTAILPADVAKYNAYDGVIVGSQWNRDLLTSAGVERVFLAHQGADCHRTRTEVSQNSAGDGGSVTERAKRRRLIFSGGKLEYRKGQDIVVAAFREYLKSDPDAVLVTAWQNRWPATMRGIETTGYVEGWPALSAFGSLDIVGWCVRNGIPARNVIDVGSPPSWALRQVIAKCDVAVFPNRCEGGTNLVAMECLAEGVPTFVVSATGQKELTGWGACSIGAGPELRGACSLYRGMDGWAEADFPSVTQAMGYESPHGLTYVPSWSDHAEAVLGAIG